MREGRMLNKLKKGRLKPKKIKRLFWTKRITLDEAYDYLKLIKPKQKEGDKQ